MRGYHFSVTTGTIFHDTHCRSVNGSLLLIATYLICESKKGVSALQLKRTLGVAYKTAWYLCHRIREAVKDVDHKRLLSGIVECDKFYIGGNPKNMHKSRKEKLGAFPALNASTTKQPYSEHCNAMVTFA